MRILVLILTSFLISCELPPSQNEIQQAVVKYDKEQNQNKKQELVDYWNRTGRISPLVFSVENDTLLIYATVSNKKHKKITEEQNKAMAGFAFFLTDSDFKNKAKESGFNKLKLSFVDSVFKEIYL